LLIHEVMIAERRNGGEARWRQDGKVNKWRNVDYE
jgi:hypothetical protein